MPALREEANHTHTHPTTDGDGKRVRWRQTTAVTKKWSEQGFLFWGTSNTEGPISQAPVRRYCKIKTLQAATVTDDMHAPATATTHTHTHWNFIFEFRILLCQLLALAIYEGRLLRDNWAKGKKQKGIPKQPKLKADPFTVAATSKGRGFLEA